MNKLALVTGGSRGIGKAIAEQLKVDGFKVITVSRTVADIEIDLTLEGSPQAVVDQLGESRPFIIVNNLGDTLGIKNPLCSMAEWRSIWRINFEVAVELNSLLIPAMKKARQGRIINICSTASLENNGPVPYCSAKAALAAYTHSMGRVLASDGIVMNGIIVGAVFTEEGFWAQASIEHRERYLDERCPAGKFGTPQNIADMVSFLASEKASFMQGALIPVDGGQSRHYFEQVTR